ncbi:hypothetical protein E9993_18125 [Labilibacter sediminis]|nr:hypothetical protein E9993_18125 [Labilibacter sediminis]
MIGNRQSLVEYSGLIFGCPLKEDVKGCVFRKLRKMELKDRLAYWKCLSNADKDKLINHHLICIFNREQVEVDYAQMTLV